MPVKIFTDVQALGIGASFDIRPPLGSDWEVSDFGASRWVGVAPAANPDINVGIFDGAIGPAWVLQATDARGWGRKQSIHVSRTNYLRMTNPGAAYNVSFSAKETNTFGAGTEKVVTDVQTIGPAANLDIIPPAGQDWLITDIASSLWVGGAPANVPDVTVAIFDGANAATLMDGANLRGWFKPLKLHISRTNYLRLTNTNVGAAAIGFSGVISTIFGAGQDMVISDVQVVGIGAAFDFRPAVGEEWVITDIAASVWLGVPPAALPDVSVQIFDGTIGGIIAQNTDIKNWNNEMEIYLERGNWLRITDTSGAGGNIGISGYLARTYQS